MINLHLPTGLKISFLKTFELMPKITPPKFSKNERIYMN